MLSLNNIKASNWSRKTSKRLGRGNGSGKGTFCARGMNGQNSRSGGGVAAWFEGGQTPLFRRMPKLKGFSNALFKKEYNVVNLTDLAKLAEKGISEVNKEVLIANGIVTKKTLPVKLLGKGELTAKVSVVVDKASSSAQAAVEKAGWKLELL